MTIKLSMQAITKFVLGVVLVSRTIEVQENQKVIDTGLYGIVRHPMYSVTLLLFLSMPIVSYIRSWFFLRIL